MTCSSAVTSSLEFICKYCKIFSSYIILFQNLSSACRDSIGCRRAAVCCVSSSMPSSPSMTDLFLLRLDSDA